MAGRHRDLLFALARGRAILSARQVAQAGIHSQELTRLVAAGVLERVARGHYRLASRSVTEHHGLVVAARVVPRGVICLLSALSFHGVGTQIPPAVWMAIERGSRTPATLQPPLEVVRLSGVAFRTGIETHRIEGEAIRVYNLEKTLADLFKHRNRVGLDVALEALREAWREQRIHLETLEQCARACRVSRLMRPYVEAIVA